MVDLLITLAIAMTFVGAGLTTLAWRMETRVSKLLARDTFPDSYANRKETSDAVTE